MKKNMMHDSITESFLNSLFIGFNIAKRFCLYKQMKNKPTPPWRGGLARSEGMER